MSTLFIKRVDNPKDNHSGQVALPGGRCSDDSEGDLTAAIRETHEEIGLDLLNKREFEYLGRIPQNFYAYIKKGKKSHVSVNVFLQKEKKRHKMFLCQEEVADAFWVSQKDFFKSYRPMAYDPKSLESYLRTFSKEIPEGISGNTLKQIVLGTDLPNKEVLWGLTFLIMGKFMQAVYLEECLRGNANTEVKKFMENAIYHEFEVINEKSGKKDEILTKMVYDFAWKHRYEQFSLKA
jgi:8-oxo-dGTP pyrophosphatase MutT (NUDIX family)